MKVCLFGDRLELALKSGLLATLASWLTIALFVSPALASQQDFGHQHAPDTPQHIHSIQAILGIGLIVLCVLPEKPRLGRQTHLSAPVLEYYGRAITGFYSRAPPL